MTRVGFPSPKPVRAALSSATPAHFQMQPRAIGTKMKEASDVVAIGQGFFVVGDKSDTANFIVPTQSDVLVTPIHLSGAFEGDSQFEAVTYDAARNNLFVAREEAGEILRYEWRPNQPANDTNPKLERKFLPDVAARQAKSEEKNKGIEGLVFLSGDQSPSGKSQLLFSLESHLGKLFLVDDKPKEKEDKKLDVEVAKSTEVVLDDRIQQYASDISAMAVDPRTGCIFLSSDESKSVVQFALVKRGNNYFAEYIHHFVPHDAQGQALERIEGLTFNSQGDLFLLTENTGLLYQLKRQP